MKGIIKVGNGGGLNMRAEPNANAEDLGIFTDGTEVDVLAIQGGWAYVDYKGNRGWCNADYVITEGINGFWDSVKNVFTNVKNAITGKKDEPKTTDSTPTSTSTASSTPSSTITPTTNTTQTVINTNNNMNMALSEKTKKWLKIGGIAVAVGTAGYFIYKANKKKSSTPPATLNGISRKKKKTKLTNKSKSLKSKTLKKVYF